MKNLSKRTKMILAIVAVVIVAAVGIAFILPMTGLDLFGATAFTLQPQDPTINVGQQIEMKVYTLGVYTGQESSCKWAPLNGIVQIRAEYDYQQGYARFNPALVTGSAPGTVTVEAWCGLFNVHHSTTVTVRTPPVITPANPTISVGQQVTMTVTGGTSPCYWNAVTGKAVNHTITFVNPDDSTTPSDTLVISGSSEGTGPLKVNCANGPAMTYVTVN